MVLMGSPHFSWVKSTPMLVRIQQYIQEIQGFLLDLLEAHDQTHPKPVVYMSISHENIPMIYPLYHHLLCLNQHVFFVLTFVGKPGGFALCRCSSPRGAVCCAPPVRTQGGMVDFRQGLGNPSSRVVNLYGSIG